jgi:AcrR family transcriptional regulator
VSPQDVYESLSRVRPPLQDRSRIAQVAALDAFEFMLRDRPLHKVTVQDVADRAKLSITSVYARFDGKKALVLALHERVIHDAIDQLGSLLAEAAASEESVEATVVRLMNQVVEFACENKHVFGAVLSAADEETNQRAAAFIRAGSEAVAEYLVPRLGLPAERADHDVDFAWRTVIALMQQSWALGGAEPSRHPLNSAALVTRLSKLFLDTVRPAG